MHLRGRILRRWTRDDERDRAPRRATGPSRVAYGRAFTMADLAAHPQNRRVTVDTASGPVPCLGPGALHDGALPAFRPVPGDEGAVPAATSPR